MDAFLSMVLNVDPFPLEVIAQIAGIDTTLVRKTPEPLKLFDFLVSNSFRVSISFLSLTPRDIDFQPQKAYPVHHKGKLSTLQQGGLNE